MGGFQKCFSNRRYYNILYYCEDFSVSLTIYRYVVFQFLMAILLWMVTVICCMVTLMKISTLLLGYSYDLKFMSLLNYLQFHQLFTHYVSCHATMEAFAVGTQRNLPDPHPIFKLLRPHFRYTMAINSRARATLINDGGIIDQFFGIGGPGKAELMKRAGKQYDIHTSNIKKYSQKRGVHDSDQLPGYHYRDDGFKVWDALQQYARGIINEFYQSDVNVKEDEEIQKWAQDIHTNGFPGYSGESDGHGFPSSISTREELIEICTLIMFTGSAQHASVNFAQYFYYRFVPNAPFGVRRPPPSTKGKADYQDLLETLPDKNSAISAIGTVHLLSEYSQNEVCALNCI